jgi:hypothetical protein
MERDQVDLAVSLGFSIIGMIIQYLRDAGVSEEVIEANWGLTKQKHAARPSEKLPVVPDEVP